MARYSIGIYWDNVSLHACHVRTGTSEHVLERVLSVAREYDDQYAPKKPLEEDLKNLLKDSFTEPMDIFVVGMQERETMHRSLVRPFGDRKKIALTIAPEVETLLPVSDGKIVVDYVLMGKDEAGMHRIETISARHTSVAHVISSMNAAGIEPEIVDAPSAAMLAGARNMFRLKEGSSYIFLHMGWHDTSFAVLTGREVRHIGVFPYGFEKIALGLNKGKALPPEELERMVEQGLYAGEAVDACIREVLMALSRIDAELPNLTLVPSGYACSVRDFSERFREVSGIPSETPELDGVKSGLGEGEMLAGFMPVSLGLRGIDKIDGVNFRKHDLAYTKKMEWIKGYAGTWTKVAAALAVLWVISLGLSISLNAHISSKLSKLISKEFASVMPPGTPVVDPVKQMEQQLARMSPRGGSANLSGDDASLEIIRDLSNGIPSTIDVILDSITIDEQSITVTGNASTYDSVEKMKAGLSGLPYVADVKIVSAKVDKNDQRIGLKLVCSRKSSSI